MTGNGISIGICDDEEKDLKQIEAAVREGLKKLNFASDAELCLYNNGDALFVDGKKEHFDLLFLDIEMSGMDGFALAEQIKMKDFKTAIVFVSAHENLIFDAQEYTPLWFVRKTRLERDVLLALRRYMESSGQQETVLGLGSMFCPLSNILYIESMGHMLLIRRTDGSSFERYGSLKSMEEKLSGYCFLRTHKSYLVNQRYIDEIGKREIRLKDGTVLEMGRDRRKLLREAMLKYEREHYGCP